MCCLVQPEIIYIIIISGRTCNFYSDKIITPQAQFCWTLSHIYLISVGNGIHCGFSICNVLLYKVRNNCMYYLCYYKIIKADALCITVCCSIFNFQLYLISVGNGIHCGFSILLYKVRNNSMYYLCYYKIIKADALVCCSPIIPHVRWQWYPLWLQHLQYTPI